MIFEQLTQLLQIFFILIESFMITSIFMFVE
jgi:hypothetical protein